jgi:hypothetical protein
VKGSGLPVLLYQQGVNIGYDYNMVARFPPGKTAPDPMEGKIFFAGNLPFFKTFADTPGSHFFMETCLWYGEEMASQPKCLLPESPDTCLYFFPKFVYIHLIHDFNYIALACSLQVFRAMEYKDSWRYNRVV